MSPSSVHDHSECVEYTHVHLPLYLVEELKNNGCEYFDRITEYENDSTKLLRGFASGGNDDDDDNKKNKKMVTFQLPCNMDPVLFKTFLRYIAFRNFSLTLTTVLVNWEQFREIVSYIGIRRPVVFDDVKKPSFPQLHANLATPAREAYAQQLEERKWNFDTENGLVRFDSEAIANASASILGHVYGDESLRELRAMSTILEYDASKEYVQLLMLITCDENVELVCCVRADKSFQWRSFEPSTHVGSRPLDPMCVEPRIDAATRRLPEHLPWYSLGSREAGIIVAGGFIESTLRNRKPSDVDLFVIIPADLDLKDPEDRDVDVLERGARLLERVSSVIQAHHVTSPTTVEAMADTIVVRKRQHVWDIDVKRGTETVVTYQIVLRAYEHPLQVVAGFDIDSCRLLICRDGAYAHPAAVNAWAIGYNVYDPDTMSSSGTHRYVKKMERLGLGLLVLGLPSMWVLNLRDDLGKKGTHHVKSIRDVIRLLMRRTTCYPSLAQESQVSDYTTCDQLPQGTLTSHVIPESEFCSGRFTGSFHPQPCDLLGMTDPSHLLPPMLPYDQKHALTPADYACAMIPRWVDVQGPHHENGESYGYMIPSFIAEGMTSSAHDQTNHCVESMKRKYVAVVRRLLGDMYLDFHASRGKCAWYMFNKKRLCECNKSLDSQMCKIHTLMLEVTWRRVLQPATP